MKIGFIDYYLDEYHANHYPGWIKNAADESCAFYAWAQIDSPKGGLTTDKWCEKYGAIRCDTIEDVCKICDFLIILSPDNPENLPLRGLVSSTPAQRPQTLPGEPLYT